MDLDIAMSWICKYQDGTPKSKNDLRQLAEAHIMLGEVLPFSEIYQYKLLEAPPVDLILKGAISSREQGFMASSFNCYRLATDNVNKEDKDTVLKIFEGIRTLKGTDIGQDHLRFLENRLLNKYSENPEKNASETYLLEDNVITIEEPINMDEEEAFGHIRDYSGGRLSMGDVIQLADSYIVLGEVKKAVKIYGDVGQEVSVSKLVQGARIRRQKGEIERALNFYKQAIEVADDRKEIFVLKNDLKTLKEEVLGYGFKNTSNIDEVLDYLNRKVKNG
jgi:tetratricopeptide (TPR) repeat protein